MTLKEIAREAGVSISTVSRVINQRNTKIASKEVQDRIWEIVRRTGYTPNSSARNLKLGQNAANPIPKSIACIFARSADTSNDPFFTEIFKAVEQEAFKKNYIVKYSFSTLDFTSPAVSQIFHTPVDGIIILGRYSKKLLQIAAKYSKNIAYTGLNSAESNIDQVICDGWLAAKAAVEYLHSLGHTQIGYVGESRDEQRFSGFKDALLSFRLPYSPSHVATIPSLSAEGGYHGTRQILKKCPELTALFCANDLTAIGALRSLKEFGKAVPDDISVISIDDIDTSQYVSPMLTTIHIPMDELGRQVAKVLIDRIEGGHHLPMKVFLPFYISKRESCSKPG